MVYISYPPCVDSSVFHPYVRERWEKQGRPQKPNARSSGRAAFQADYIHECQLGCALLGITNFKLLSQSLNGAIGPSPEGYDPEEHGEVTIPNCDCTKK